MSLPAGQPVRQRRPWVMEAGVSLGLAGVYQITRTVFMTAAQIVSTAVGGFGHANGLEIIPAYGTLVLVEFVSAVLSFNFGVAAYTLGGNVTVNDAAGSAISGLVSAANSFGAGANKYVYFNPLAAAARNLSLNTAVNLVAAAAFTNPGTATGTAKLNVTYRIHPSV